MSLLEKFDSVNITPVSFISEYDKSVCEQLQQKRDDYIKFAQDYIEFVTLYGVEHDGAEYRYMKPENMIKEMQEQIEKVSRRFIGDLSWHFQKTYNVTLDTEDLEHKYDHNTSYQQLVDDIVQQLDGMNFTEKALQEIKDKLYHRTKAYWDNDRKITIKNNKISLTNFLYWESSWSGNGKYRLRSGEEAKNLYAAITHFERGTTKVLNGFNGLYDKWSDRDTWFNTYEFEWLNKLQSIRYYKNGKVDIKFASSELAAEFAREYLNYTA